MKEKKQFFIPKNYDKKFEWIPGISGWQHIAFLPVIALDYSIIQYTPFEFSNKVVFIAVSLALPWVLMGTHPVRENVPLYKHLYWRLKFLNRQRTYQYKKEGFVNVVQQKEGTDTKTGAKKAGASKENNSRLDSIKVDRARIAYHARKQDGSVSKSVSH